MPESQSEQSSATKRMRVYFRFCEGLVPDALKAQVITRNTALRQFDATLFALDFDPTVFTHALQLLGQSSTRFGNDLSPYLACVHNFFERAPEAEVLSLAYGTSDFKKRMSEDLGVSLASLFMVESFGIEWHTIAQIPENRSLSRLRPDFEGFADTGERYLYEAKGRSTLDGVIPAIDKAVSQVKTYPEAAVGKLALVTYFSSNEHAFASQMFLADPQLPDTVLPDRRTAEQLHLVRVFDFGGFTESRKAYVELLRARFAEKSARQAESFSPRLEHKLWKTFNAFAQTYEQEASSRHPLDFEGHRFLGRIHETESNGHRYRFIAGVHCGIVDLVSRDEPGHLIETSRVVNEQRSFTSVFTDGTLLRIEKLD